MEESGFDTLYYPTTAERFDTVFDDYDSLRLDALVQEPHKTADFGYEHKGKMFTFTNSPAFAKRAAEYYRCNVKNPADVVILRLTAPQRLTRPAGRTWELKYGDDRRKMVSTSRKTEDFKDEFEYELHDKFRRSEGIVGPISMDVGGKNNLVCTRPSQSFQGAARG